MLYYTLYFVLVLAVTIVLGYYVIGRLKQLKLEQTIRDDGPQTHLKKMGTPSMGGLIFLIPILIVSLFYLPMTLVPLIAMTGYAILGGYDDLEKRVVKKGGGLSIPKKLLFQILIGILVGAAAMLILDSRLIGFGNSLGITIHPVLYSLFIIFFIIAVTNGVNFTDGLDGLATLVSLPVFLLFAAVAMNQGKMAIAGFCGLIIAALLGFLFFNRHPAKIFMGDTGSLAIGGALAAMAVLTRTELLMPIIAGLFVIIAASVVLQVGWFKLTKGKRLFKMAPLQHHFELLGWAEITIVIRFWIICGLCVALGLGIFYAEWTVGLP